MAMYNYETGEIIRENNGSFKSYNEIVNDSLVKEGRKSKKEVESRKSPNASKKKGRLTRYIAVLLGGVLLGVGIYSSLSHLGDSIKKEKIRRDLDRYYSNYAYSEIVFNEKGEACTAYRTDYTASYLYGDNELDVESIFYFIGDSYYYYPEKTMAELFQQIRRTKPELREYENFQDYINKLGFEDFEDYRKGYLDVAIEDFEKQAQIHQEDPDYPFKYNFDKDDYYIVSEKDLGGR